MVPAESDAKRVASPLALVRASCEQLVAHADCSVLINQAKLRAFVADLDWAQYEDLSAPVQFPLNFRDLQDEVNFLTLYSLLNFGSGFRKDLKKYCERGAAETILYGLIGMYISVPKLSGQFLQNIAIDSVANYFSIPLERDEELSPGIYIAKPGPLKPLAQMLQKVLNESGQKLVERNYADFGAFVLANLHDGSSSKANAAHLVQQLVSVFPAFEDQTECRGVMTYLYKRAQLVVFSLHRRFHESNSDLKFEDIRDITLLSDNVLPCVLHALGILEYSAELDDLINRNEELPAGLQECEIRAAAIVAGDQIVAESKGRMTTLDLDAYLWRVGKEPHLRVLERHATRDTFYY